MAGHKASTPLVLWHQISDPAARRIPKTFGGSIPFFVSDAQEALSPQSGIPTSATKSIRLLRRPFLKLKYSRSKRHLQRSCAFFILIFAHAHGPVEDRRSFW